MSSLQMRIAGISFLIFIIGIVLVVIPSLNTNTFDLFGYKLTIPMLIMISGAFVMLGVTCGVGMILGIAWMIFPNLFNDKQSLEKVE